MGDSTYEPVDPILARNQYAALFRRSGNLDAEVKQAALAKLVTANIDKAIRDTFATYPVRLQHAQVDYLVGLIVAQAGQQ